MQIFVETPKIQANYDESKCINRFGKMTNHLTFRYAIEEFFEYPIYGDGNFAGRIKYFGSDAHSISKLTLTLPSYARHGKARYGFVEIL